MNPKVFTILFLIFSATAGFSQEKFLYQVGQELNIQSTVLGESRKVWIQIPEDARPYEKFPVVYILDGGVHFSALATVHKYYWCDHMPRMILVGISNRENRTRDLTISKLGMNNTDSGGSDLFTKFISDELIPYVESNFPATNYRTLIGHSLGGLFTVNVLLERPDLFANYIAIDPALDWDDQKILKDAAEKLSISDLSKKSLFVSLAAPLDRSDESVGIEEVRHSKSDFSILARSILSFVQISESYIKTTWEYYPDEIHSTVPYPSIRDGLCAQFQWYRLENVDLINNPGTAVEEMERLFDYRAKKLKDHFGYNVPPADEEMLNMGGYMFMQMNQIKKAGLFFEMAVKSYPKSINAHDSMAEYFLSIDEEDRALEELQKAYELSGEERYSEQIRKIKNDNH